MSKRVLIIDDDRSVLYSVKRILEVNGVTVVAAGNGIEGLTIMRKVKGMFDLILLDIMMPEMDGLTTFKHIKKFFPKAKVIFLSAVQPSEKIKKMLLDEGHVAYLQKPFDYAKLTNIVLGEVNDEEISNLTDQLIESKR